VRYEEALDGGVEHDNFDPIVCFECRDDVIQLWNALGAEDVEGWVVEGNAPTERYVLLETDPSRRFWTVIVTSSA